MKLTPEERLARERARDRRWREKRRDHIRAYRRAYYAKNRDKLRAAASRDAAKRRQRIPHLSTIAKQKSQERAAGRPRPEHCEVCGGNDGQISFDHCHQRGIFRGWLCTGCNSALGHVRDDPNRLLMLVAYLKRTAVLVDPQLALPGI